jgi:hypothetical protein
MVSAVTVEYGLHEGRFWLPRAQTIEGDAQVSFMHIPFKLEQRFSYASVNGTDPMPDLTIAVGDTARDSVSRAARRERRSSECKNGTERIRTQYRSNETLRIRVVTPCDSVALAHSPERTHDRILVGTPDDRSDSPGRPARGAACCAGAGRGDRLWNRCGRL